MNFCLIPEVPFVIEGENGLLKKLEERLDKRGGNTGCRGRRPKSIEYGRKIGPFGVIRDHLQGRPISDISIQAI